MKSLEKLILEMKADLKAEMVEMRAGQKEMVDEMREMRKELATTRKKVLELEETVKFLNDDCEDLRKKNVDFNNQIEFNKKQTNKLSLIVEKIEKDDGELFMKVNQMDNFLRRQNVEIQGVPVTENEDLEKIVTNVLKIVDPHVDRKKLVFF